MRHPGYEISQQKRTEEPIDWAKTIGGLARPMLRGTARMGFKFTLTTAAYNLVRLPKLLGSLHDQQRVEGQLLPAPQVSTNRRAGR